MKPKPKVGQTLYRLNIGNNARHCPQVLTPVIVSKVGRKYFTVSRDGSYALESEHHVEDWSERTDYAAGYALYESPQAWADEKETLLLWKQISETFRSYRMTISLEALRSIASIIDEERKRKKDDR